MPAPQRTTIEFAIRGPITRADLAGLCDRLCRLLASSGATVVLCDVSNVVEVDAVTVDALARLQLAARRQGCVVRLLHVSPPLRELLTFMGLAGVISERPNPEDGAASRTAETIDPC
ncbi:MAG: STAS domain-containing protein [Solirubrobacterales bacterium]|nr:STAS domain-containing protein [Solirubrobacterales bacterium]MBV9049204.1 STAS domain-containing protein [Solirubrobacterales bacterium]